MFSWLDLLAAGLIAWKTVGGYLFGFSAACKRLALFLGSALICLFFASNCAIYVRPYVAGVFRMSIEEKVVAASSTQKFYTYLGPWQQIVGLPSGLGLAEFLNSLLSLAVNVTGFCILLVILSAAAHIFNSPNKVRFRVWGGAAGFVLGIVLVSLALAVMPVLALGERGTLFVSAMEESWTARLLAPFVQALAYFMSSFVA